MKRLLAFFLLFFSSLPAAEAAAKVSVTFNNSKRTIMVKESLLNKMETYVKLTEAGDSKTIFPIPAKNEADAEKQYKIFNKALAYLESQSPQNFLADSSLEDLKNLVMAHQFYEFTIPYLEPLLEKVYQNPDLFKFVFDVGKTKRGSFFPPRIELTLLAQKAKTLMLKHHILNNTNTPLNPNTIPAIHDNAVLLGLFRRHINVQEMNLSIQNIIDTADTLNRSVESLFPIIDKQLFLQKRSLTSLKGLSNIPEIETVTFLRISQNPLARIEKDDFENLSDLVSLDLSENLIAYIAPNAFQSLHALEKLYLNNNQLTAFTNNMFTGLKNLQTLLCESNRLATLEQWSLKELVELQELGLSDNHLSTLPVTIFKNTTKLNTLYLASNQFTHFAPTTFAPLQNLNIVTLEENQFNSEEQKRITQEIEQSSAEAEVYF